MNLKELNIVLDNYIEATNSHNFLEVKKCISSAAVYWFASKTCERIEEIEIFFCSTWGFIKEEKYSVHNVKWISISSESATCIYNYKWEGYIEGIKKDGGGRATNVFKKEKGKWLLIHEHLSSYPI